MSQPSNQLQILARSGQTDNTFLYNNVVVIHLILGGDRDTGVAIDEWYNEIQYFRYGAPGGGCDAGQVCGHYTQVDYEIK